MSHGTYSSCYSHNLNEKQFGFPTPTAKASTVLWQTADSSHWARSDVDALTDHLDSNILVTGLLFSSMFSMTTLHSVASSPTLRTTGYLACLIDVVGLLTSLTLRLRLKLLRRDSEGRDQRFTQAVRRGWSRCTISAISPIALIASSIILFLVVLSGSLFTATGAEAGIVPHNVYELATLAVALALSLLQILSVLRTCVTWP